MKAKRLLSFTMILCLLGAFCAACAPAEEAAQLPEGYTAAGTVLSGGQETGDINAKALRVETILGSEARETRLTFDFVTGSRISGGTEESAGCGVPSYNAYILPSPSRLVVEFPMLAHWDYTHGLSIENELVAASFQQTIVNDPTIRVYFQLNRPAAVSAREEGDRLILSLRPLEQEEAQEGYYVTVNAYAAYCAGAFSREVGVTPTLASDGSHILLISPALESEEAAQDFLAAGQALCPDIPAGQWQVCTLLEGALPEYQEELAHISAYQTPVVRYAGEAQTLPVLVPNGLYLCDMPEGGFLYSRALETAAAGEEDGGYQQLWAMRADGESRLLTGFEFAAIEDAQFSPDGRKLAILERAQAKTHLYIFDTDTWELLNDLSEMGFGGNTSAFAWNSLGNTVYAITGSSGMQLHQFDYSIPDETRRHSIVDRNSVDEGGLGLFDGELYFCTSTMEEGSWIYRIKPEGGVRKPFVAGNAFVFSADNRFMALQSSSETGGQQRLSIRALATGAEQVVTDDFYPYDMIWSPDCEMLYYIESRISGGQSEEETSGEDEALEGEAQGGPEPGSAGDEAQDEAPAVPADPYPYTLWAYDVASGSAQALLDLCAPDLFAAREPGVLYLNRYETDEFGVSTRACYRLDLSALAQQDAAQPAQSPAPAE